MQIIVQKHLFRNDRFQWNLGHIRPQAGLIVLHALVIVLDPFDSGGVLTLQQKVETDRKRLGEGFEAAPAFGRQRSGGFAAHEVGVPGQRGHVQPDTDGSGDPDFGQFGQFRGLPFEIDGGELFSKGNDGENHGPKVVEDIGRKSETEGRTGAGFYTLLRLNQEFVDFIDTDVITDWGGGFGGYGKLKYKVFLHNGFGFQAGLKYEFENPKLDGAREALDAHTLQFLFGLGYRF